MQKKQRYRLAEYSFVLFGFLFFTQAQGLELNGQLNWVSRVQLSTAVAGVVDSVLVMPGDQVKQGRLLLKLEDKKFRSQISGLKAQLKKLKVIRDEAWRELERANELYDRTLLSDHELQTAKNAFSSAEADFELASSTLAQAQIDFQYSQLKAPFDAVILSRHAETGMIVNPGLQPPVLLEIASLGSMFAEASLSPVDRQKVKIGQTADIVVNGDTYSGRVTFIGLEHEPETSTYKIQVQFETGNTLLPAGLAANIKL